MGNNQGEFRPYLSPLQVWLRRQEEQQVPTEPVQIEEIEKINAVVVRNPLHVIRRECGQTLARVRVSQT